MKTAHDKVVIITGAGSGIGRSAASLFAEHGFRVALAGRTQASLEQTVSLITGEGSTPSQRLLIARTDVADPSQTKKLIESTVERFGRIDVLINCAGQAPSIPIEETDPTTLRRIFEINAMGPAYLIHGVWPIFQRQRGGCIINISTMGTRDPFPGFFAYAASKAALNVQVMSCAKEGREWNIRAFAIAPGAVETPTLRILFDERTLPPDQCLAPIDIARVMLACALGERDDDNGQTIFTPSPGA